MKLFLLTTLSCFLVASTVDAQTVTKKQEVIVITDGTDSTNDKKSNNAKKNVVIKTIKIDGDKQKEIEKSIQINQVDLNKLIDSVVQATTENIDINVDRNGQIKVFKLGNEALNQEIFNVNPSFEFEEGNWIDFEEMEEFKIMFKENANRPFLGVILDDAIKVDNGIKIINIIENSSASEVGLLKGDDIIYINDEKINSLENLSEVLGGHKIGEEVKVIVLRDSEEKAFDIKLKSKSDCSYDLSKSFKIKTSDYNSTKENCDKQSTKSYKAIFHQPKPKLGIHIQDLDSEMISDLKVKNGHGILVTKVLNETAASKMGLKVNDVIQKINGIDINSKADLFNVIQNSKLGDEIEIQVVRYGKKKKMKGVLFEFSKMEFNWED